MACKIVCRNMMKKNLSVHLPGPSIKNRGQDDFTTIHIFYRQLNFPSEPGVANEILENEAKSCLAVA